MLYLLYEKHQAMLEQALIAIQNRGYWSPYSENAGIQGDEATAAGYKSFKACLDAHFYLDQPGVMGRGGAEISPYGIALNVSYPLCNPDALIAAGKAAIPAWVKAGADVRVGVCAEILARLNEASMEIAHAIMHTTGQSLSAAFQSGGPHAQDRGLEALAMAYREMKQTPEFVLWKRPQAAHAPAHMEKTFRIMPRGAALVIASPSMPTWHAYPGIFASLATGNPVIIKPHPQVILPLAISVALARMTLKETGFDPNLICLLVDAGDVAGVSGAASMQTAREIAQKPDVRIIDYAGNRPFSDWLVQNARQAELYIETDGVNYIVIDSTDDYDGMLRNLALTLSLNAGQMNAMPQTLFVPAAGIRITGESNPGNPGNSGNSRDEHIGADEFMQHLSRALGRFVDNEAQAVEALGAIQSPWIEELIEHCAAHATVLRDSVTLSHPQFPAARVRTPLLLSVDVDEHSIWMEECAGPIRHVVKTASTMRSLAVIERTVRERGALTLSVYSTDPDVQQMAEAVALRVGVALSLNLTGSVCVNQTHGFSDFQASGANPAGNVSLASSAFVARRFYIVPSQRHLEPHTPHAPHTPRTQGK